MITIEGDVMKRLATLLALLVALGTSALAHEGNEHIRGVVTQVSSQSVTVQVADKAKTTKTLALTAKTAYSQGGKPAHLSDLKVGDRVVIDVPEHTTTAVLIQFTAAPASTGAKATGVSSATDSQMWAGTISDAMCGAKHTMAKMADRVCTQFCAKAGTPYVLVSGTKIYKLTNRAADLFAHAGQAVTITGTLKGDSIQVAKVEMPASSK
jgi:hypothetical protein